jgi:hypothetical protein
VYHKNVIYLASALLLLGCMDNQKQNNEINPGASIEDTQKDSPKKGITFKKNVDGKYVLYDGPIFQFEKKDVDPTDLSSETNHAVSNSDNKKSKLADVFTVRWPWKKTNTDLNDESTEEVEADVSTLVAETEIGSVDDETETTPDKSKSMLPQFFTVVWPWEKTRTEDRIN